MSSAWVVGCCISRTVALPAQHVATGMELQESSNRCWGWSIKFAAGDWLLASPIQLQQQGTSTQAKLRVFVVACSCIFSRQSLLCGLAKGEGGSSAQRHVPCGTHRQALAVLRGSVLYMQEAVGGRSSWLSCTVL
jgi:hypothetical protein